MIFNRSYSFKSSKSSAELKEKLKGEHLKVHEIDFEIFEKEGMLKVIPHAEKLDDKVLTLPITRLVFKDTGSGCEIKMKSKARRIDVGGPSLALFFLFFIFLVGLLLYIFQRGEYFKTAIIAMSLSAFGFIIFWYRLEIGYLDYIRKIKKWIVGNI